MSTTFKINPLLYLFILLLIVCSSCQSFYKISRPGGGTSSEKNQVLHNLQEQNRYFILRSGGNAWSMKDMVLSSDQKSLTCALDSLSYLHRHHLIHGGKKKMKYRKNEITNKGVLNEVHLYIPLDTTILGGSYVLSLDKVQRIEVIEKDKKRTTTSYVLGITGFTLGVGIIAGAILANAMTDSF